MKRDMDLIREILLKMEADQGLDSIPNVDKKYLRYQIDLLTDANLVVFDTFHDTDISPALLQRMRMTWQGHEFLDSVRDPAIWRAVKEKVLAPAASWTFSVLLEIAKNEIRQKLGL